MDDQFVGCHGDGRVGNRPEQVDRQASVETAPRLLVQNHFDALTHVFVFRSLLAQPGSQHLVGVGNCGGDHPGRAGAGHVLEEVEGPLPLAIFRVDRTGDLRLQVLVDDKVDDCFGDANVGRRHSFVKSGNTTLAVDIFHAFEDGQFFMACHPVQLKSGSDKPNWICTSGRTETCCGCRKHMNNRSFWHK